MNVELKHYTPMPVLIEAIRTCYDSMGRSDSQTIEGDFILGIKDKELIMKVVEDGHGSTLEHLTYSFKINGLPRFILQELVRHRIASYSVKSTRFTLSELKYETPFVINEWDEDDPKFDTVFYDVERAAKYLYLSGNTKLDNISIQSLEYLRQEIVDGTVTKDEVKQIVPENYLCDLMMTLNARSLCNLLYLRSGKRAHFLIQQLAAYVFGNIPAQHKFIFEKSMQ